MTRRALIQYFLAACLLAASAFAAWAWLRPYAWQPDPAARCTVDETLVTRDNSFFWVDVHLKLLKGARHDLAKPVRLKSAAGGSWEPSDTTLGGPDAANPEELWYKFWIDEQDIAGILDLQINDGVLHVKTTTGVPSIPSTEFHNFTSSRW